MAEEHYPGLVVGTVVAQPPPPPPTAVVIQQQPSRSMELERLPSFSPTNFFQQGDQKWEHGLFDITGCDAGLFCFILYLTVLWDTDLVRPFAMVLTLL